MATFLRQAACTGTRRMITPAPVRPTSPRCMRDCRVERLHSNVTDTESPGLFHNESTLIVVNYWRSHRRRLTTILERGPSAMSSTLTGTSSPISGPCSGFSSRSAPRTPSCGIRTDWT